MNANIRELPFSEPADKGSGSAGDIAFHTPAAAALPCAHYCPRTRQPGSCDPWERYRCRRGSRGSGPVPGVVRADCEDGGRAVAFFPLRLRRIFLVLRS